MVNLFTYLTDKDLFAEIYRNQLAKRLLNQRSSSDDWEKLMIGKLKHRCGAQFTGKVRRHLSMRTCSWASPYAHPVILRHASITMPR